MEYLRIQAPGCIQLFLPSVNPCLYPDWNWVNAKVNGTSIIMNIRKIASTLITIFIGTPVTCLLGKSRVCHIQTLLDLHHFLPQVDYLSAHPMIYPLVNSFVWNAKPLSCGCLDNRPPLCARLNSEHVVRILKLADYDLPRLEGRYYNLKSELKSLEAKKESLIRTIQEYETQLRAIPANMPTHIIGT